MDRSLRFYRDLIGLEVVLDTEMSGPMLDAEVGLEGAHLRLVELGTGDGQPMLELLQYYSPDPREAPRAPVRRRGAPHRCPRGRRQRRL